jgi:hypothetical protein
MKTEFRASREPFSTKEIHIRAMSGGLIAKPVQFIEHEDGYLFDPVLTLDGEEAQQLIDELWRCGLRPTEGAGSAGSLAATEKHLSDMRTIAFKQLNIKTK